MKKVKIICFFVLALFLLLGKNIVAQGTSCSNPSPFCSDQSYSFPNNTGQPFASDTDPGNNYGCLVQTPNPAWYYMEIQTNGQVVIDISQEDNNGNGTDVDFILYGPYNDLNHAYSLCGSMGTGTSGSDPNAIVDCSYSISTQETATIQNAQSGEVYVLLLTNYADEPGTINFSQTGGSGATDCSILNPSCVVDNLTATPGACQSASKTYTVSGNITFTDPPTTGTLTVTDCNGNNQVFNAPFNSPQAYSLSGLTPDGANCNITAVFSDDPACTQTVSYTAPTCPCKLGQPGEPDAFTFTLDSVRATCGQPNGAVSVLNLAGGTPNYTYNWNDGNGPTTNNTLSNQIPGTYTVIIVDDNGCDTTASITVDNIPGFTGSITTFTNVSCNGLSDGEATASGSDHLATYTYNWNTNPAQNTETATGLSATIYECIITDVNTGCKDTVNVTIGEPPLLTVDAGNDVAICVPENIDISATGTGGIPGTAGYIYSWDNSLGTGQSHNVSPTIPTTYTVTVTDSAGCTAMDNILVDIHPPLIVTTSANDSICPGDVISISAQATPGSGNGGPYTYTWDNNLGTGQSHNVSPSITTTYTVTLSDGCSPDVVSSVTITVNQLPIVNFLADTSGICETALQPVTFWNISPATAANILWDFGDGSRGSGDTVSHIYNTSGSYDITLTITDSVTGCPNDTTKFNYVEIFADPVADFTMDPNPANMLNPTIYFYDESYSNITGWTWNIGGLDTINLQNPTYTFPEDTGTYTITLTVVDNNGCINTTTNTAIVQGEYGLYLPNAFTPDGDGLNESFRPNGFGIVDESYHFYIFNKWGELIFESEEKFAPWDGTYEGKFVPNGVYIWRLDFKDLDGVNREAVGQVNVIK